MHLHTRNVNTAFRELVTKIHDGRWPDHPNPFEVIKRPSRNGSVLMIDEPVTVTYTHPKERVLFNAARDANPFLHLYEALWMLAGRNDVEPLAYYAKQMREYSDDGKTLNGAYGCRWRHALQHTHSECRDRSEDEQSNIDQLDVIVNHLKADPTSRRAVLQMWNVEDDLLKIGRTGAVLGENETYQMPSAFSKDVCCNLSVMFSLRNVDDGYMSFKELSPLVPIPGTEKIGRWHLDMTVTNRSNDMVWGMLGANYVHFTFLQEYMAARLGAEVGRYHHFTNNLHVYDWNWKPDEWLNDRQQDWYGIGAIREHGPITNTFPLVKDPSVFDKEVKDIVNVFDVTQNYSKKGDWQEPFLKNVAYPMLCAFNHYKMLKQPDMNVTWDDVFETVGKVKADDWRIAATNWLGRRAKA